MILTVAVMAVMSHQAPELAMDEATHPVAPSRTEVIELQFHMASEAEDVRRAA
jgi:hypothetical protein